MYESFVRYLKEEITSKEGQELKLIIRDTERYSQKPVIVKVYSDWRQGMDKLSILDPLGRPWKKEPWGLKIVKEQDEEKLFDTEYHKAGLKV
jgi:hypothetical protein